MAKRKRLTPAQPAYLSENRGPAPETKSLLPKGPVPIAQVAGDASATAALHEVSEVLRIARAEGRLIQSLPLEAVESGYLVRDRMGTDEDELTALIDSLRARGQQTAIEVVALEEGRFGLISGWRRLTALRRLYAETGEDRFATVQALLRQPETASDAYLAMVEENEIRVGLSYYERARVVVKAAEKRVYPSEKMALKGLFASASRAKRSKIGAFIPLYHALDDQLRFPNAISERLGLSLAKAIGADPALGPKLRERLRKAAAETAEGEQAVLARASGAGPASGPTSRPSPGKAAPTLDRPADADEPIKGIYVQRGGGHLRPSLTLSGPKMDQAFQDRLLAWLKTQG